MKYHILFNPLADNGTGREQAAELENLLKGEQLIWKELPIEGGTPGYIRNSVGPDDVILICGGDGTVHRFVNDMEGVTINNRIDYYATGNANDFLCDLGICKGSIAKNINRYIEDLPKVTVNGRTCRFINGVGFGIDGYCCEVADQMIAEGKTDINYAGIAIKGLAFAFTPLSAKVTVDGETYEFKDVWLAPTMKGRFYGGGMMPTPGQKRMTGNGKLSTLIWHGSGRFRTLALFSSIFKGEHLNHDKICVCYTGRKITVVFDRPCALHIDGETVSNVTEYTAEA